MASRTLIAATAFTALFAATNGFAQSTGGSPLDPNSTNNQQPSIGNNQPSDPAAADNPEARVPTAPELLPNSDVGGAASGAATGEAGSDIDPPATVIEPGEGNEAQFSDSPVNDSVGDSVDGGGAQ